MSKEQYDFVDKCCGLMEPGKYQIMTRNILRLYYYKSQFSSQFQKVIEEELTRIYLDLKEKTKIVTRTVTPEPREPYEKEFLVWKGEDDYE